MLLHGSTLMRSVLRALISGLRVAVLGPAIGALVVALAIGLQPAMRAQFAGASGADLPGFAIALLSGAYLLGLVPAFITGLSLPWLQRHAQGLGLAVASGLVGMVAYGLSSGSHLVRDVLAGWSSAWPFLAAFVAGAVASRLDAGARPPHTPAP